MRIAYWSPFAPQATGIADYSEELLPYLAEEADITLFVDGYEPTNPVIRDQFPWHMAHEFEEVAARVEGPSPIRSHVLDVADRDSVREFFAWAEEQVGKKGSLGDGKVEAGENETADLARAVQNPGADLISLPLQNNTNFEFGPRERTQNVLNIQPVVPFDLSEDWLMITRTIVPVISQPSFAPGQDRKNGLEDTLFSAFVSPQDQDLWIGGDWL